MLVKALQVGQIQTNCYIVTDENTLDCVVIDPGDESNTILDYLEDNKLHCKYIFITHGHYDHTGAAVTVSEETGAPIYINEKDANQTIDVARYSFNPPEGTRFYKEGDEITMGGLTFKIIETPGHTPGGVAIICEDCLFVGDTLFRGSCGRIDLPGGNMRKLLKSLYKLAKLPGDYEVYPGHMEFTTLERERNFNMYMVQALDTY